MESIWKDTALPSFPAFEGDLRTEVLVIGGGMAGLLCAYCLQQAGVSCIVAEANTIAGGITRNTTAKLTAQPGLAYHKLASRFGLEAAGLYLQANEQALNRFRQLCRETDCDLSKQDNHIYSRSGAAPLEAELNTLQALGAPAVFTPELPLPFPTDGAVTFPRQAQFHPLKLLAGIAPQLTVFEHTRILALDKTTAVANRGRIAADKVIIATHFPFLNLHGSYFLKLYQQRSYVLALEQIPVPEGMYLDQAENGLSFRGHGKTLLLGGGGHRTGKQGGNWKVLEAFAAEHYPDAKITHRWATQDCMSLDGLPYIGQYSARTPNVYVTTGFNKWGMVSSMVSAQLLTDLILGKENPYADLFSPSRSMLHPQLGINMLESTKNLLTPTAPRCPHLGCTLKWNPQERSWDCPCHGSRFTADGQLIDNPATGDLKRKT